MLLLYKSLDKKIDFSWIMKDVFNFCIKNNNWEELSIYLEKKVSTNNKKYREKLRKKNIFYKFKSRFN